jgi:hypothetical protein
MHATAQMVVADGRPRINEPVFGALMNVASMPLDTVGFAQRQIDITSRHARVAKAVIRLSPLWLLKLRTLGTAKVGTYKLKIDAIMFRGLAANVADHRANGGWSKIDGAGRQAIDGLTLLATTMHDLHGQILSLKTKSPMIHAAISDFAAAASEVYDSITGLRWEFLELEASRSRIDTGYAASTAEEVDEVFARIVSE